MALAFIFFIPDETRTMHLFRRTRDINSFYAKVKFFNWVGTAPNHNPFANAYFGVTPAWRLSSHVMQMYGQSESRIGPLISCIESLSENLSRRVAPMSALTKGSKLHFASDNFFKLTRGVSCPHTVHPPSAKFRGDVSSHQFPMTISTSSGDGGEGGNGFSVWPSDFYSQAVLHFFSYCLKSFSFAQHQDLHTIF